MQSQKGQNDLFSFPRQIIQYHGNQSLCPDQYYWISCSWMVLWRPTRRFNTDIQKRYPFHYRGLECKSQRSRNIWSNRQMWDWSTEWSRAKANRVLPREHTGHSKHPLPTKREDSTHGHHQMANTEVILFYYLQPKMAQTSQQGEDLQIHDSVMCLSPLPN